MTIPAPIRQLVRERSGFACEYCGVDEVASGGELAIDHFQPVAHGGSDNADNLLYCCPRCNQYKSDYWPREEAEPRLWNPREELSDAHFLLLADGAPYPRTPSGAFTIARLRLNRPPLIAHRRQRQERAEALALLAQYRAILELLQQLTAQQATLLEEQHTLLLQQATLLQLLLNAST